MKKIMSSMRVLFLVIPMVFVLSTVLSNCSDGDFNCDGDVLVDSQEACSNYAVANGCEFSSFDAGICNVENCLVCEDVVDDDDPVIDVDDIDFDDGL